MVKSMQDIIKKYINYIVLLTSLSIVVFLPYQINAYRYLGPILLGMSIISLRLNMITLKELFTKYRFQTIATIALLILSSVAFVPSTTGTLLLLYVTYLNQESTKPISVKLLLCFLYSLLVYLALISIHWKFSNIPWMGKPLNSNYIAVQIFVVFCLSVKLNSKFGKVLCFLLGVFISVRNIQLAIIVYSLSTIPFISQRLTKKSVIFYFFASGIVLFIGGQYFKDHKIQFPFINKDTYSITVKESTLDSISSTRLKLNNYFLDSFKESPSKFIFGQGNKYQGSPTIDVHNSTLILVARNGLVFTVLYILLLTSHAFREKNEYSLSLLIAQITFSLFIHGAFETFPIIILVLTLNLPESLKTSSQLTRG